jgi:hypothetical protein
MRDEGRWTREEGQAKREEGQGTRDEAQACLPKAGHEAKDKRTKLNFQLFLSKYGNILQIHRL